MDQHDNLPAAAEEWEGTLARAVDAASTEAHDGVDRMSAAVYPAVDRLAAGAHESVEGIAAVASQAAETITRTGIRMEDARVRVAAQCRDYVRENPLAAMGLAMAAGYVVSRLVSPRSSR